jgi:hydrogenase expression/formation protein HypC
MCLSMPGRIVEVRPADPFSAALVDCDGVLREACLAYMPDAVVGEYVIIHSGYAINRISETEARAATDLLREMGA